MLGDWGELGPRFGLGEPVSAAEYVRRTGNRGRGGSRLVANARAMLEHVATHPELLTPQHPRAARARGRGKARGSSDAGENAKPKEGPMPAGGREAGEESSG